MKQVNAQESEQQTTPHIKHIASPVVEALVAYTRQRCQLVPYDPRNNPRAGRPRSVYQNVTVVTNKKKRSSTTPTVAEDLDIIDI